MDDGARALFRDHAIDHEHGRMDRREKGQRRLARLQQGVDFVPGALNAFDMLEDHAREHQVEAAGPCVGLAEVAAMLKQALASPCGAQSSSCWSMSLTVTDRPRSAGLVGKKPGSRPPADFAQRAEAEAAGEPQHQFLVVRPGPVGTPVRLHLGDQFGQVAPG